VREEYIYDGSTNYTKKANVCLGRYDIYHASKDVLSSLDGKIK
jgi:hypothetical protein